jgi:hypothetical protein
MTSAEKPGENLLKFLVHQGEGLQKTLSCGAVDALDSLLQCVHRFFEVFFLP